MSPLRPWFRTRRVLPAVLVAVALADLITRGLPINAFTFRAWEAMIYYKSPGTAFEANATYEGWSYGDLANLSNLAAHRIYRHERWMTDAYGFRNPAALAGSGRVQALLIGDSFAAGSGVSDHDTLSGQLTARGVPTYNVAPVPLTALATRVLADRLSMPPNGWVLYEQVGSMRYMYLDPASMASWVPDAQPPVTFGDRFKRNLDTPIWPLRIAAEGWLKSWQDDHWFPNPYRRVVEIRRLVNGDTMLFFPGERVDPSLPPHALEAIDTTATRYRELNDALGPSGLRLAVVLVPDRFALYAHLIPSSKWPGGPSPYLNELDRRLQAAGVRTVNLHAALAEQATVDAASFRYLYWLDDTHWNGRGIAVAADVVTSYIASQANETGGPSGPTPSGAASAASVR